MPPALLASLTTVLTPSPTSPWRTNPLKTAPAPRGWRSNPLKALHDAEVEAAAGSVAAAEAAKAAEAARRAKAAKAKEEAEAARALVMGQGIVPTKRVKEETVVLRKVTQVKGDKDFARIAAVKADSAFTVKKTELVFDPEERERLEAAAAEGGGAGAHH